MVLLPPLFTSCKINYGFTGGDTGNARSISISYFDNYAPLATPTLSETFTEELRDLFQAQTNLELVGNSGDLHFEGEVTGYRTAPIAVQGNETAALNRLTVTMKVRYVNTLDKAKNFESSFSRFADYDATADLSSVEDGLIEEIIDQLVQEIFNRSVGSW